jgi:hypothetical protein
MFSELRQQLCSAEEMRNERTAQGITRSWGSAAFNVRCLLIPQDDQDIPSHAPAVVNIVDGANRTEGDFQLRCSNIWQRVLFYNETYEGLVS